MRSTGDDASELSPDVGEANLYGGGAQSGKVIEERWTTATGGVASIEIVMDDYWSTIANATLRTAAKTVPCQPSLRLTVHLQCVRLTCDLVHRLTVQCLPCRSLKLECTKGSWQEPGSSVTCKDHCQN